MLFWPAGAFGLLAAYLLGATPTGYLAGRLLKGIDIREHGSKSTGATNVLRTLGAWPALAVLIVDVAKGAAAVLFAARFYPWLFTWPETWPGAAPAPAMDAQAFTHWAVCLAGLAALIGHSRSVWLGFTGGKSAAAGLGLLLAMSWPVGLGTAAAFALVLAVFRIVSLGSMLAATTAGVLVVVLDQPFPYRLLVIAGGLYVIYLHRANIGRLLAGTKPRLGRKGADSATEPKP